MLTAYLYGTQTFGPPASLGPPLLVIAGFVSESAEWARGQQRWSATLSKAGTVRFDITAFEAAQEVPWTEWTERKRRAFLHRLVTLIASATMMGTAALVRMDDYDRLDEDTKRQVGNPYVLAACACVAAFSRWCERLGFAERVMYVFDGRAVDLPRFRAAVSQISGESDDFKNRLRLGLVTMEDERDVPALQMANLLAWEVTRYAARRLGFDSTPPRRSMERLLEAVPLETAYFDANVLRAATNQAIAELHERAIELFGLEGRSG